MEMNTFAMQYGIDDFMKHERMLAQEDISGLFVNTSFIEEGDILTAIYRYDGYLKASECRFYNQLQILNLMEKMLTLLSHASDYYISPTRLEISTDTVFYRPSDEDVRMAFVIAEKKSLKEKLLSFLGDLSCSFQDGDKDGIELLMKYLREQPFTIRSIIMELRRIKSEL